MSDCKVTFLKNVGFAFYLVVESENIAVVTLFVVR